MTQMKTRQFTREGEAGVYPSLLGRTPKAQKESTADFFNQELKFDKTEEGQERAPTIEKEAALALQRDLMLGFSSPAFQRELHELSRQHGETCGFRRARLALVRRVQLEILPQHGFEANELGVEKMLTHFQDLKEDLDVEVNSVAINDLLNPFARQVDEPPTSTVPTQAKRPSTKYRVLDLLHLMLKEFGKASVQRDVMELKRAANYNSRRVFEPCKVAQNFEDPEGYLELEGRQDLMLIVLKYILPSYGFESNPQGLQEMMRHCAPFFQDPEVAELLDATNAKLGMSISACHRWRAQMLKEL